MGQQQHPLHSKVHFDLNSNSATSLAINLSHLTRFYNKRVIYKYIKLSISISNIVCTHILAGTILYIEIQGLNAIFLVHSGILAAWF